MVRILLSFALTLAAGLLAWSPAASARIVVIAHSSNPEKAVTAEWVRNAFLGYARNFPSGHRAIPVDQSDDQPVWSEFAAKILDKTPKQLKAYWSVKIFSGRGQPPPAKGGDKDVTAWIADHAEAVGYLAQVPADKSVKVLLVVP
jgi:hypothetical protein